jgi:hypothetical protein
MRRSTTLEPNKSLTFWRLAWAFRGGGGHTNKKIARKL